MRYSLQSQRIVNPVQLGLVNIFRTRLKDTGMQRTRRIPLLADLAQDSCPVGWPRQILKVQCEALNTSDIFHTLDFIPPGG